MGPALQIKNGCTKWFQNCLKYIKLQSLFNTVTTQMTDVYDESTIVSSRDSQPLSLCETLLVLKNVCGTPKLSNS